MSDEKNEMLLLLKELVGKVKSLEEVVYQKDNLLMKSGLVVVDSPRPAISNEQSGMSGDTIAKMDWSEINQIIETIEG
tara:strand:+ start:1665 stop:1898 length:234 start_codon:yes stop_codon:yes gene_type:complete